MLYELVVRATAEEEIDEIADWYEGRTLGAGIRFLMEIEDVFLQIQRNPLIHTDIFLGVRRALPKTFPYAIYFEVISKKVRVLAVVHTSRNPLYHIRRMLSDED